MFNPPYGKPWLLYGILGGSLALNVVNALDPQDREEDPGTELVAAGDSSESSGFEPPSPGHPSIQPQPDSTAFAASASVAMAPALDGEWRTVNAAVQHSLARTLQRNVGESGDALSAVFARLFVWDFNLRKDLLAGDQIEVIWREDPKSSVEIAAARLHSTKHGQSFTAYRWHAPGDTFTSWWQEDGTEASYRLQNPPLRDYEQITALLKDGRNHKGMDFKTPVGTQAIAPYNATVTRVNWNTHSNGNCIELRFRDGVVAKYLHLSDVQVSPGQTVSAGQVIALTGNTGRSTAPHLHYQLEKGRKVLDPIDYHGTIRRKLHSSHIPSFQQQVSRYDSTLSQAIAQR